MSKEEWENMKWEDLEINPSIEEVKKYTKEYNIILDYDRFEINIGKEMINFHHLE